MFIFSLITKKVFHILSNSLISHGKLHVVHELDHINTHNDKSRLTCPLGVLVETVSSLSVHVGLFSQKCVRGVVDGTVVLTPIVIVLGLHCLLEPVHSILPGDRPVNQHSVNQQDQCCSSSSSANKIIGIFDFYKIRNIQSYFWWMIGYFQRFWGINE